MTLKSRLLSSERTVRGVGTSLVIGLTSGQVASEVFKESFGHFVMLGIVEKGVVILYQAGYSSRETSLLAGGREKEVGKRGQVYVRVATDLRTKFEHKKR